MGWMGRAVVALILTLHGAPASGSTRAVAESDERPLPRAAVAPVLTAARDAARPRIGLVLGGGSARGLGHIGMLKVLEELRVPVDRIAGTSMGAVVGGLYALGLSPHEIEATMLSIDWEDLFSDLPQRAERPFRRKQDDRSDLFNFEIGFRDWRLTVPGGLVAGQKLVAGIRVPELITRSDQDFDALPIPLRVVATDVATGEMVALRSGSLLPAVRASMSIPGVFAPVGIGDRLLVDGGVVRNIPIDVCEEMGADVIIASDVGGRFPRRDERSPSLFDITNRATWLALQSGSQGLASRADVYMQLELLDFGVGSFLEGQEIVRRGEAAARRYADSLARFSVTEEEYAAFHQRHRRGSPGARRIAGVELDNRSRVEDRAITERIRLKPGDALDLEQLDRDLARVYGLGMFELVDFELAPGDQGSTLRVQTREKRYAPNIVNLGLEAVDDLTGRTTLGFLVRHTWLEANRLGAEWRTDLRMGLSRGIASEWYQPLDHSRVFFIAPHARLWHEVQDLYAGDDRVAEYGVQDLEGGIGAGVSFGGFGELRTGIARGRRDATIASGRADVPTGRRSRGTWRTRFEYDLLNRPDFPTRGGAGWFQLRVARRALGDALHYGRVAGDVAHFVSFGKHTFHAGLSGGSRLGPAMPFDEEFVLGGPQSQFGLRPGQHRGQAFGLARLGYQEPFHDKLKLMGLRFYVGGVVEAGNTWSSPGAATSSDLLGTFALLVGATSPLGPVQLGYGRSHRGDDSFFLTVGRQFGSVGR